MVRIFIVLVLGFGGASVSFADESAEPTLLYSVKVGNKTATLSEGAAVQLEGSFTNPEVSVTPAPFRVFPYQGISFKYPKSFTYEADLSDTVAKTWTLSGNDFKIMLLVMNVELTPGAFAENLIIQFGAESCKVTNPDAKIVLGDKELSGASVEVVVAEHKMVMDIFQVSSEAGITKLLVFQDSLDDAGNHSAEGVETLKEIKASFSME